MSIIPYSSLTANIDYTTDINYFRCIYSYSTTTMASFNIRRFRSRISTTTSKCYRS